MKRVLLVLMFIVFAISKINGMDVYYMRSSSGEPWVNSNNVTLMNQSFGNNGWILGVFQSTPVTTVFNANTKIVFMEGSNMGATALANYLATNQTAIESWVNSGGMLFLNSAPDQGSNFSLGFGGVTLNFNINYNKNSNSAAVTSGQLAHAIFNGSLTCGTSWTGLSFAQATLTGGGITALITGNKGTVMAEKIIGLGRVIFGTMTLASFHSPQPQGINLRLNILSYLNNNAPFIINCTATNSTCLSANNGMATVTQVFGGKLPFTYLWSNGNTNSSVSNLLPGTYTVTVTDFASVTRTCSSIVSTNPSATISVSGSTTICSGDSVLLTSSLGTSYLWSNGMTTQIIAAKVAGSYSVVVATSGCNQTTLPVNVTISSLPTIMLNGPATICPGYNVTLTASNGSSYLWSNGMTTQSITTGTGTTYTVTVTSTSGCVKNVSQTIALQQLSSPIITAIGNSTLCPDSLVTLSSSNAYSYNWNNGVTSQTLSTSNSGSYTVTIADALGCTAISNAYNVLLPTNNYALFGNNIWNVYAFSSGGSQYNANAWNTGYSGFYTDNSLSFNTQTKWPLTSSPSSAANYQGCSVNHDNHAWSAKRQGFPCGYYQLDMPAHDAVIELFINEVQVWQHTGSGIIHTNVWSGYLNSNSKIEVRGSNGIGDSYGSITLIKTTSNLPLITNSWYVSKLCNGQNLNLIAPAGANAYLWSNGNTNSSINLATAGTFTVTITDATGCSNVSAPFQVTTTTSASPNPIIVTTPSSTICQDSTTVLSLNTNFSTYLWSNGITSATISVNQASNYSILVSSTSTGCRAVAYKTISITPKPLPVITTPATQICAGKTTTLSTGSFSTYLWSNGISTQTVTSVIAGTYTVTVTVGGGCSGTGTIIITQRALPIVSATASPSSIFTGNTSQLTALPLTAAGPVYSVSPITYSPIPGSGTAIVLADEELSAAQPIGFNFNFYGISYSQFYISSNGFISFSANSGHGCCLGQFLPNATAPNNLIAGAWSDLDPPSGGTIEFFTTGTAPNRKLVVNYINIENLSGGAPETFQIVLNETDNKIEIHITQVPALVAYQTMGIENSSGTNATAVPNRNSSNAWGATNDAWCFSIIPNNSFTWTPDTGLSSSVISNPIASPPTSTPYTVTVTDYYGCSATALVGLVVSPNANPTINGNTEFCIGDSTNLSVANGYSNYIWSNGKTTNSIFVSSAGIYTITVTNLNGSTGTASVTISTYSKPNVSISGSTIICQNSATTLNAVSSATNYLWSTGSSINSIQVSAASTYTVTVTNSNGCTNSSSVTATISPNPNPVINGNTTFCLGNSTTLSTNIYAAYQWSTGATTQAVLAFNVGNYTVTVYDANGCSGSKSISINNPTAINYSLSGIDLTCIGSANGAAYGTVVGGLAPYTFVWNTGATTTSINNLSSGTYTATVTDNLGCTATSSITILQPSNIEISETKTNVSCFDGNNGSISLAVIGGILPYTYLWNTGSTLSTISNLSIGNYITTVTDFNGCSFSKTIAISQPDSLKVFTSSTNANCGQDDGTASAIVLGGTTPYNFNWSNGSTVSPSTQLVAGIYTVTVSDFNGCTKTSTIIVSNIGGPTASIDSITNVSCFGGADGGIDLIVVGGNPPYNYLWQPISVSFQNIAGLPKGKYECIVTDANGCITIINGTIIEPDPLVLSFTASSVTNIGSATGSAIVTVTGGVPQYTYLWSNGSTNANATGLLSGTYTVTIADNNNCVKTDSVVIGTYPQMVVSANATAINCFGDTSIVTVTANGGSGIYTGTGNFSETAGTYSFTVSDNAGSSATATLTINEPLQLNVSATPGSISCFGGSTTIVVSASGGIGQYVGTGTFTTTAGPKTFSISDSNGCIATKSITINQPTQLFANATANSITCYGGTTTVNVTATGGTPPYSGTGNFTMTAGIYSYTVTDAAGCTSIATITINEPTPFIATSTQSIINCGGGTAQVTVSATGGISPLTGIGTFTVLAGIYTYTITDNIGCTATTSIVVAQPEPIVISKSQTTISCFGGNATVSITATGGTPPYIGVGNSIKAAGTYNVIVTDNKGCTSSLTYNVNQPTTLSIIVSAPPIACKNGTTLVTVSATGGTPPYTGTGTFPVTAGSYTFTVTDSEGCTKSSTIPIPEPTLLNDTAIIYTPIICYGGSTYATVTATGGTPPYSGIGSILTTAGNKTFTVTDNNGCIATNTITVSEPAEMTITPAITNAKCFGSSNGKIILTIANGNGTQTYLWSNGDISKSLTNLIAGTYSFTVTDAIGCTNTGSYTITEPALLTAPIAGTNINCFNGTTGAAIVNPTGGTTPYSYLWNSGATTAANNNLAKGTKTVTVTDALGCSANNSIVLTELPKLDYVTGNSTIDINCFGEKATADIAVYGGTTPYTYSWNSTPIQTTSIATNLGAGSYSVLVTDANNCTILRSYSISQPAILAGSISVVSATCNGVSSGSATANPTGGNLIYSYLWSNGKTTKINNNIVGGLYTVTVSDNKGCTYLMSSTVPQPNILTHNETINNPNCNGSTGSITLNAQGGVSPYSYSWNGGNTNASRTGLAANNYTVTITDLNGCTKSKTMAVIQPSLIVPNSSLTAITCNGANNGIAGGPATGGTPPYTYQWNNGNTTILRTSLSTGTYTVTVSDSKSCTMTKTYTISQPNILNSSITTVAVSCYASSNGTATATNPTGGTSPFTYLWSNSTTDKIAANLAAGTYSVTVSDSKGCTFSSSTTLALPPLFYTTGTVTNTSCSACTSGAISIVTTGGATSYNYIWNNGTTNKSRTALGIGTYTITATDSKGCTEIKSYTINVQGQLSLTNSTSNITCGGSSNGSISANVTGGTTPYSYLWNGGNTNATRNNLVAGTYTVTVTDGSGNTKAQSSTLVQPSILSLAAIPFNVSCNGSNNGVVNASGSGGNPGYSYLWNTGNTTSVITNRAPATYTVTVTDAVGCTITKTAIVSQPASLSLNKTVSNISCNNAADGTITFSVSGGNSPYTYIWSNGYTVASLNILSIGTYTTTVTDSKGCTATSSTTITQPLVLSASVNSTNLNCNASNDGTATAIVTGGTAPYAYSWNSVPVRTTATASGLPIGNFTVTVTDNKGCTATASTTLSQPVVLNSVISSTNLTCNNVNTGTCTIAATGGTTPYQYLWSNGFTNTVANNLNAATYTVTVTDNKGCTITKNITLTQPSAITIASTVTNLSCNGGNNGIISTAVSGGSAPYSFLWNNGNTSSTLTNIAASNYTLVVTDNSGCTKSIIINVGINSGISLTTSKTNNSCGSTNNGMATVNATGGSAPFLYSWNTIPISTNSTITNLATGTYTVTVTDNSGCTNSTQVVINTTAAVTTQIAGTNVSCFGNTNGSATITAISGNAPYTYLWSNGMTLDAISGLATGIYTATVTDVNGCSNSSSLALTQPSILSNSITKTNVSCFGFANGYASASVSGGTPPYSYLWNTGNTNMVVSGLAAATYSITVTDANGCSLNNLVSITEPSLITIVSIVTNVTCNGYTNGAIVNTYSGGTPPYNYLWNNGNTNGNIAGLAANTFAVTVTDANGCTKTSSKILSQPVAITLNLTATNLTCQGINNGSVAANAINGIAPYTYIWNNGSTNDSVSALGATTYSVTVTDANGCTLTKSIIVTQPTPLLVVTTMTNVTCNGYANGSIANSYSGGTPPYNYIWNNGATSGSISGLVSNTYTVTITDVNGCTKTSSSFVSQPVANILNLTPSNITCNGLNNGSCSANLLNGIAPYTYLWSNGNTNAVNAGLAAATYSVTVTDANGCSLNNSVTITQPSAIIVTSTIANVSCNGYANGAITNTYSGGIPPYNYLWNNGVTNASISGLTANSYTVTTTDGTGCTKTSTIIITEPIAINLNTSVNNVTCNGLSNGSVSVNPENGIAPYTYLWDNGNTNDSVIGLGVNTYSITVTAANGCTANNSISITQPAIISVSSIVTPVTIYGYANGTISTTFSGGTPPYTYMWNTGNTNSNETGLTAGNYSITATDANGCSGTFSFTITQPDSITLSLTAVHVICNGFNSGSITANAANGVPPLNYFWSDGTTNATISDLYADTYTVTVTDVNGASLTASTAITQPTPFSLSSLKTNVTSNGGSDGSVSNLFSGATPPYNYLWNNGNTNSDLTGLSAGTYTITVTDVIGCSAYFTFTITQPGAMTLNLTKVNATCSGLNNGSISATVTNGNPPYTYLWSDGTTNSTISDLFADTYTVTVTDVNGVSLTDLIPITQPTPFSLSSLKTNVTINGGANGSVSNLFSGATPPYTYLWNNGSTSSDVTGLSAGIYTITVTDAIGCSTYFSFTISQPAALNLNLTSVNITCFGLNNGSITALANNGTSPYTYLWNNGKTTATVTGLSAGSYIVTVTDANGATLSSSALIAEPAVLTISSNKTNITCFGANNGTISITNTGGTSPYAYLWNTGAVSSIVTNLSIGNYTVTVTDANGCSGTISNSITQPATSLTLTMTNNDVSCNGLATGIATASPLGGSPLYSYLWSNGSTNKVNSNVVAGTYTVTVTDLSGCSLTGSTTVIQFPVLSLTTNSIENVSCNGGNNGSVSHTGSGGKTPYSYLWSTGSVVRNQNALTAGTYTFTITDNKLCTVVKTYIITQPNALAISISKTDVSIAGGTDGTATASVAGGTATYSYSWNTVPVKTTMTVTGLSTGNYIVTVTDIAGCTKSASVSIAINTACVLATTINKTNITCNGLNNGNANVTITNGLSPFSYVWSNGNTTSSISNLAIGTYTVTVTDANQCNLTSLVSITQPAVLNGTLSTSNVTCFGLANGSSAITISGGTTPYTYNWNNGSTNESITGLAAATYTATTTDANGCSFITNTTITQPPLLSATGTKVNSNCSSSANGSINLTITGGTLPYNYLWSNGNTNANVSGLSVATYTVTVTDSKGCIVSASFVIGLQTAITTSLTSNDVSCNGFSNGIATALPVNGLVPYSYLWSNGSSTKINANISGGNYTVTVTDAAGCSVTGSILVTEFPALVLTTTLQTNVSCFGGNNGVVNHSASGGKTPYSYLWSTSSSIRNQTALASGTYTFTVTDSKNCTVQKIYSITQPSQLAVTISKTNVTTIGGSNGTAAAVVTGGISPYTYSWNTSPIKTTSSISGLIAGTYTVTVTDANSCTSTKSVTITQPVVKKGINLKNNDLISAVFPNPSSGNVFVTFNEIILSEILVSVYDPAGQLLFNQKVKTDADNVFNLNLVGFAKGIYILKYTANSKQFIDRIVIH